jgi:hypothetical protein
VAGGRGLLQCRAKAPNYSSLSLRFSDVVEPDKDGSRHGDT